MKTDSDRAELSGATRTNTAFLKPVGDLMRRRLAPRVPAFIATYHLTMLTLPLGMLVLLGGYLARGNVQWVWLISAGIAAQYVVDVLDGEVGRQRQTGLIRWGFYMDHFSDFLFGAATLGAYMLVFPSSTPILIGLLVVTTGFYLHEALVCICTGKYNVYGYHGIGWEEARLLIILENALIAIVQPPWIHWTFVAAMLFFGVGLVQQVWLTQRALWRSDLEDKGS
jgi:phosphatidylglycerophosphate synthase